MSSAEVSWSHNSYAEKCFKSEKGKPKNCKQQQSISGTKQAYHDNCLGC